MSIPPANNFDAKSAATISLLQLEDSFMEFCEEERKEVEIVREALRQLVKKHGAVAKLAMLALTFEIAISEGQ